MVKRLVKQKTETALKSLLRRNGIAFCVYGKMPKTEEEAVQMRDHYEDWEEYIESSLSDSEWDRYLKEAEGLKLTKRVVPEALNLAIEVCFQRDNISPHIWSRGESFGKKDHEASEFGTLYCETFLSDDEWEKYLWMASGELKRSQSAHPNMSVVDGRWINDFELLPENFEEASERLGSSGTVIK